MISLIKFEQDLIIPKDEAEKLGLKYNLDPKIGYRNEELSIMGDYDHFKEDCIKEDDKYYKNQKSLDKDSSEADYYLYTKYTGTIEYVHIENDNHLVDINIFAPICKHLFSIKESILSEEPTINNIQAILHTITEKTTSLNKLINTVKDTTFNSKTNVHVGGGLITTYNDLLLKEDVCTDVLQQELNNGWRIIAVCNQPDQRRPDYILGRFNPQLQVADKENAER